jgi:hypothetical protein
LQFKRAFVYAAVYGPIKTGAALIKERRRSEVGIACINGRTARQQLMCEGRTAIVL